MAQALIIADRVKQTSNTTGTGNLTFATTVSGFRAFSAVTGGDSIPFPYSIKNTNALTPNEWEEGIGVTATGGTVLVRRVIASSNSNNPVNFSAGPLEIALTRHAAINNDECDWGTGQDGALNITSSDVNLTDDAHYTTITWGAAATGKINANGFRVHALDECDTTNAPAGGINNDAVGGTGGGWGTVGGGCNGQTQQGATPNNSASAPAALLGGRGGAGAGGAEKDQHRSARQIGRLKARASTAGVPAGGPGSEGDGAPASGVPGAGGGVVEVRARRFRRTSATATGAIRANGSAAVTNGSGGGGGRPRLLYGELLGSSKTGLMQANGGDGVGSSGSADGGDGGTIETHNLWLGTSTHTVGSTVSAETAGTCSVNV